jgi:DNA gyrase subunit A
MLKKDEPAQTILNQLYIHTNMQVTFGINLVAIVHNRPELLSLKDLLHHFLEHRREVILRRTRYELKQAEARAHILEGFLIALNFTDREKALRVPRKGKAVLSTHLDREEAVEDTLHLRPDEGVVVRLG